MTKFATPFNRKYNKVVLKQVLPSMTDQDKKDECDLNFLIKQYVQRDGKLPCTNAKYADLTKGNLATDYLDALQLVSEHSSNFEMLPAVDRERFGSVSKYLEFISNPANLKEAYTKGYIDRSTVSEEVIFPERFIDVSTQQNNSTTGQVSPSPSINNPGVINPATSVT